MDKKEKWFPTKAELHRGRWRGSRNPRELAVSSRAVSDWTIQAYERLLRKHVKGSVVDLGCGRMPYYGIYGPLADEVIGVDWPGTGHGNPFTDVICDLNDGIALPDSRADTIVCTSVFEHIFEIRKLWKETARVLRPGGCLIVGIPFFYWIHEAPHDYHRYTEFALRRYAEEVGLAVERLEATGGLPHVLVDLTCKATRKFSRVSRAAYFFGSSLLSLPPVKRFARTSARQFPLGYVMVARKSPE